MSKIKHVAVILSSSNVRRLLPGVMKYSSSYLDYWLINVLRSSEEIIDVLKRWNPAGILTEPKEGFVEIIRSFRKPLVLVPANIDYSPRTTSVNSDDVEVGRIAAQHFIDLGIRNFAFFESYFSNFIEGTKFTIEEAKKIIETQTPIQKRTDDSHDILGTYQITANRNEMSFIPNTGEELLNKVKNRHSILLKSRPDKNPGQFKEKNNQAGNTLFVDYQLVKGTLKKGFELFRVLENPFSRAAFMMFLISEVHPFDDGNGRIARIMMNAELVNKGESKIIIPNVYRDDYLLALRKLSREKEPAVYIRMLERAFEFSSNVYFEDYDEMLNYLEKCNCFYESDEGKILKIVERQ